MFGFKICGIMFNLEFRVIKICGIMFNLEFRVWSIMFWVYVLERVNLIVSLKFEVKYD